MAVSAAQVRLMAINKPNESNMGAMLVALEQYDTRYGLDRPHRVAQFLAQVMHESLDFKYDKEIWGPTEAQKRYDTRTDLGNTPQVDGDGKLYIGRTPMQLTGKDNYRQFRDWARREGLDPPDFVARPDLVNTDPWEGLVPIWYWSSRDINRWADQGDIETVTKKINGGKNGLEDRIRRYSRCALVLLGYGPDDVRKFQASAGLDVDGDAGPKTRAALHRALVALVPGEARREEVRNAPVTEDRAIPVTPPSLDQPWYKSKEFVGTLVTGGGITGASAFMEKLGSVPWQNVAVLVAAALVCLGGFLLYRRSLDKKKVEKIASSIGS